MAGGTMIKVNQDTWNSKVNFSSKIKGFLCISLKYIKSIKSNFNYSM